VLRGPNNNQVLNAPQLTIGDPPLTCGQGSSAGNFGTILLSHSPYTGADKIGAANVALGLTSTLSIYPVASRLANGTCSTAQPATILWTAAGTNCVDTDTGMSSNVATGGLLGTGSSAPASCSWTGSCGLLAKPFTTKCGAGNTAATAVVGGVTINNDVLSCFFTNTTVKVGDIDTASYSGPPVLSSDIYNSPRFGYVPVLPIQPTSGGSNKYQIIDFRPCFITNQTASAQKGDVATGTNGLTMSGSAVQSVQVIFINGKALPVPPVKNGTINYMGSGPKIPLLVN
jgi:hypothetical protein